MLWIFDYVCDFRLTAGLVEGVAEAKPLEPLLVTFEGHARSLEPWP